jgi:hypothetical protein
MSVFAVARLFRKVMRAMSALSRKEAAARREWEEATAAKADAAEQARAELDKRGPARWNEAKPEVQAVGVREVQAADVEAEAQQDAQAETSAEIDAPEADREIDHVEPEVEAGIEQRGGELTGIDPEALATMAEIQGNLAAA